VDGILPGTVDDLRATRSKTHQGLQEVFEQWQREKKSFKEKFAAEKAAYGHGLVQMYVEDCLKRGQMAVMMMRGQIPPLNDILPSRTENLVKNLEFMFQQEVGKDLGNAKLVEFSSQAQSTKSHSISSPLLCMRR